MTVLIHRRKITDQGELESVEFTMTATDQLSEIKLGQTVSVYDFSANGLNGQITVWHDSGRAAIDFGEGSRWGDWDEATDTILLDGNGSGRRRFDMLGQEI